MDKAIALLSGGIDSPVAIHLMQHKVEIIAAHFHQKPLTDGQEIEKCKELLKILNVQKLYLVPFAEVLKMLVDKCQHKNYYILQKIVMMKAAELIAQKENAKYLITGENLAQVSSQTLSNLSNITKNINLEIFRPVLTFDKQEIIDKAKSIGTYEISSGPEMCNLLGPKRPATKSKLETVNSELENLDLSLLQKVVDQAEIIQ